MPTLPEGLLTPARDVRLDHLSAESEIVSCLEQLHYLALSVCPDCLIQQRNDEGLIYVPFERREAGRDKNLLTVWAEGAGVRMRIMPDPEEKYDPGNRVNYLTRMLRLHDALLQH